MQLKSIITFLCLTATLTSAAPLTKLLPPSDTKVKVAAGIAGGIGAIGYTVGKVIGWKLAQNKKQKEQEEIEDRYSKLMNLIDKQNSIHQ